MTHSKTCKNARKAAEKASTDKHDVYKESKWNNYLFFKRSNDSLKFFGQCGYIVLLELCGDLSDLNGI